jgi:hypothetical protein
MASTTYEAVVGSKDASGNLATSSVLTFTTAPLSTTTPVLSAVTSLVGDNAITLNWNTNEAADSEVYYATSSPVTIGAATTTALTDATLVTSHSLTLDDLTAGTTYYFIIESKDADGNTGSTPEFSTTTMNL